MFLQVLATALLSDTREEIASKTVQTKAKKH